MNPLQVADVSFQIREFASTAYSRYGCTVAQYSEVNETVQAEIRKGYLVRMCSLLTFEEIVNSAVKLSPCLLLAVLLFRHSAKS